MEVGFGEGKLDGDGVFFPGTYVGSSVGDIVGAFEGKVEGEGVAFPGR